MRSLRARLLGVVVILSLVGLLAADIATYVALKSFLTDRLDNSTTASAQAFANARGGDPRDLIPRDLISAVAANAGTYVGIVDQSGTAQWFPIVQPGETPAPAPDTPGTVTLDAPFTVDAVSGGGQYRVVAEERGPFTVMIAAPLSDLHATLNRLLAIEIIVTVAVIALVIAAGLALVRLGLRPLRRIEETAGAIAAGDLSQRVDAGPETTEVGRLGAALNVMLERIEEAFAARKASEDRLRRFVGDASHELRTPIAAVQAYAELFDRGARHRPDDLERAMHGIEKETRRMGLLVDDLLLLARLDQGRPLEREPVAVDEVAREAVEAARMIEPERPIALSTEPATVIGDSARLRQVMDNLLANVRSHTPDGAAASVRVSRQNGHAVIEVTDSGPGLDREQAAKAFERFYRADPSRSRDAGGTGLGLAIVNAIAQAHGGSTMVSSVPGDGATFTIELPVYEPPQALHSGDTGSRGTLPG
jgi:two-component system OmpR family sensor kinase